MTLFSCICGNPKQAVKEHPAPLLPEPSSTRSREQQAPPKCDHKVLDERRRKSWEAVSNLALHQRFTAGALTRLLSEASSLENLQGYDIHALLQYQRLLSDLRGTWLSKTHAALSSLSVFLDVADAR
jgi:hypothetical protein